MCMWLHYVVPVVLKKTFCREYHKKWGFISYRVCLAGVTASAVQSCTRRTIHSIIRIAVAVGKVVFSVCMYVYLLSRVYG